MRGNRRAAARVAQKWTLGCGALILISIGIAVVALVVALEARRVAVATGTQIIGTQARILTLEINSAANAVTNGTWVSACAPVNGTEYARCVCAHLSCDSVSGLCTDAPSERLALACTPCEERALPCYVP